MQPWAKKLIIGAVMCAVPFGAAQAQAPLRIAVLDDMTGPYSGNAGPGTTLAVTMAVEDHGGSVLGRKIEVLSADHQNKPDGASTLARQFIDQQQVTAFIVGGASSAGLAIQTIARQANTTTLVSGGFASNFSGEACSPFGTHWPPSTIELSKTIARGIVEGGGKSWYFIVADYVFGKSLYEDASKTVIESGGKVLGRVMHPLSAPDQASQILTAQASGAQVIGLANAADDSALTIKQAREFGLTSKLAAMLLLENNVVSLGLDVAQGLRIAANFYWDLNDDTRTWSRRFMGRYNNRVPTMSHMHAYLATSHYLKAVAAANTTDAKSVQAKMRELPIKGGLLQNPRIQENGRVVSDMFIFEVKKPSESKEPADLYKLVATLPGDSLFLAADKSGCPLTAAK